MSNIPRPAKMSPGAYLTKGRPELSNWGNYCRETATDRLRHVNHMSPVHITRDMVTGIRSNSIVLLPTFVLVTGFSSEIMFLSFLWLMPGFITFSESGYNKSITQTSYFTVLLNYMFCSPRTPKFTPDISFYCVLSWCDELHTVQKGRWWIWIPKLQN